MSVFDRVLSALRRVPRGFPADGRPLGIGLAAAMDAQRARERAAGPAVPTVDGRHDRLDPARLDESFVRVPDDAADIAR